MAAASRKTVNERNRKMGKISFANSNNKTIAMSAVINFPAGFDERRAIPPSSSRTPAAA